MSRTIHGCVNWTTGQIEFADVECTPGIYGCIIWTGEHAGQVKVIISGAENPDCNDTYYGCVDWATGQFEIEIPNYCCIAEDCDDCYDEGKTPEYFTAIISDVETCAGNPTYNCAALNGTHKLAQNDDPEDPCGWIKDFGVGEDTYRIRLCLNCASVAGYSFAAGKFAAGDCFRNQESVDCIKAATYPNFLVCGQWPYQYGYGGNVEYCEGWHPGGCP